MHKIKVLALATTDTRLGGHAYEQIQKINSQFYDVKLVTQFSLYNEKKIAIYPYFFLKRIYGRLVKPFLYLLKYGKSKIIMTHNRYAFYSFDYSIVSANQILNKYGDHPDVIMLYWHDGFISSKLLKKLYEKTKAPIVYIFVDEFPLGGGCHYPNECEEYKRWCDNCPAITYPLGLAGKQLKQKVSLLKEIPKIVLGTSNCCLKAKSSQFFKNCKIIPLVDIPDINNRIDKKEARNKFNLPSNAFVIMFGANYIDDERKGFPYLREALKLISTQVKERPIIALIPGNRYLKNNPDYDNILCIYPGRLSLNELFNGFVAADIFINPSIADAGPMMVNYSIACGTPVISFNIGVAMDLVINNITGYIADFKDPQSIARGILKFYSMNYEELNKYKINCLKLMQELKYKNGYKLLYDFLMKKKLFK